MKLSHTTELFWTKRMPQPEINPTSGFRAVRPEGRQQRRLNSPTTHPCDVIDTAIDWEEIGERSQWFSNFSKNLSVFKLHRSNRHLQDYFTRLMMVLKAVALLHHRLATILFPFFFLLRKAMKSLRRIYDKKRSIIQWMKQIQRVASHLPRSRFFCDRWPTGASSKG